MDGDIGSNPISILHSQNFPQFHRKLRRTLTTIEPLNSVMGSCLAPNLLLKTVNSQPNLVTAFAKHLVEFVPQNGKRRNFGPGPIPK